MAEQGAEVGEAGGVALRGGAVQLLQGVDPQGQVAGGVDQRDEPRALLVHAQVGGQGVGIRGPHVGQEGGAQDQQGVAAVGHGPLHSRRQARQLTFRKATSDGFDYLPYSKFCPPDSWALEFHGLVKKVLDFSSRHELKTGTLLQQSQELPTADPWQLCVGHDLIGFLAVGLRKRLGTRNLSVEDLQERLRLAFERGHLEATAMYQDLRAWEARQRHHRVLKD